MPLGTIVSRDIRRVSWGCPRLGPHDCQDTGIPWKAVRLFAVVFHGWALQRARSEFFQRSVVQ